MPDTPTLLVEAGTPTEQSSFSTARFRSLWPEFVALCCYAGVLAAAIPYHEPWADEAQAWQLAKSLSLPSLFHTYLRYEGSPGLWHFLLWVVARLDVSYTGMHWMCDIIATVATAILLFKSPFPRYIKLLLPFTYFLIFQYAVVARNYVLAPLLFYLIAIYWKRRPILVAVLLGLLANVALHLAVISGGLAIAYCIVQLREGQIREVSARHRIALGGVILFAFYAFAIWTALPPPEMVHQFHTSTSFPTWAVLSLVGGICSPWWLSIFFWIAIAAVLHRRRAWFYLIPVVFFAALSGSIHVAFWHMGLLVPLLICFLWITWPASRLKPSRVEISGRMALLVLIVTQIAWSGYAFSYDHFHPYSPDLETAQFLRPFVRNGDAIAVTFLNDAAHHSLPHAPQADTFLSVGILPYFHHSIYVNEPYPFWPWKDENEIATSFDSVLATHPRIVLVEVSGDSSTQIVFNGPKSELLRKNGYKLTNIFCSTMPIRFHLAGKICHVIFQHAAEQHAQSATNQSFQ